MTEELPKILVVDDTPANLAVMRRLLSKLECELVEADNGNAALAAVLDYRDFALILLDVQMPEMDGYEVASLIREDEDTHHIPIVFVTAAAADEMHEEQGYESGAIDYVTKPVRPQILLSKARIFLELWHSRRRIKDANRELEVVVAQRTQELRKQLALTDEAKQVAEGALRVADEAQKVRTRFLSRISHELRTPLNGVHGMLQLIQRDSLDQEQLKCLKGIEVSASALSQTLNELIDFADLERGNVVVEQRSFHIGALLTALTDAMRPLAEEKGLKLRLELPDGDELPRFLVGDPDKVRRIVGSYIGNAIRFSEAGRIDVRARGTVSGDQLRLHIEVEDQGPGIPEDLQKKVFHGFSQADDSTTRENYGVGLGLAISYELARAMQADVGLDSRLGEGTRAWLEGDFGLDTSEEEESEQLAQILTGDARPRARVLVAEDNVVNQMVASGLLKRLNCDVDIAANGQIALEKCRFDDFELILMDLDMPVMDGFEATRGIRSGEVTAGRHRAPIVALTANVASRTRKDCVEAGMDGFLAKPVTGEALDDVLQQMVYPAMQTS